MHTQTQRGHLMKYYNHTWPMGTVPLNTDLVGDRVRTGHSSAYPARTRKQKPRVLSVDLFTLHRPRDLRQVA